MTKRSILEAIARKPLIFDGAMGTMIYQRGVFLNSCYDELNLTKADLVRGIHEEYVEAGVDVIETNSFGANRIKLTPFGLGDKVREINEAAVANARDVAGDEVFVAASVGPCVEHGQDGLDVGHDAIIEALAEQLEAIAAAGPDLIALETFHDAALLRDAARVAHSTGIPVLASYTITPSVDPAVQESVAAELDADANIDILGLNCGLGPAELFHPVRRICRRISKPLLVAPNAGGPREVGGRMLYLNSPEYFTEFAKRFIELGARAVGGCCGTTPAHIRMAARALKSMSGVKEHLEIRAAPEDAASLQQATPFEERSSFAKALASGKQVTSVEILPPQSKAGLDGFLAKCRTCEEKGVDAINLPDGPRASARMSVVSMAALMTQSDLRIEPIPHYCCRDRNLIGMQSDLLGASALGLNTWLFITGDPPKLGNYPDATGVFDLDAIGIVQLAANLNRGFDAAGQALRAKTDMVIGVGANPVAVEMQRETDRYYRKIDAGAEYAITQPIFEVEALFKFIEEVSTYNRTIPVIAGIYPLLSLKNAEFMNEHVPGVEVPMSILERMAKCTSKEDGIKMGIEIARETREKLGTAVQGFQASAPLGKIEIALDVLLA